MQTNLTPVRRFDALDRERFRDMVLSPPFREFRERVKAELARAQAITDRADEGLKIRRAQGAIEALRMVLSLPDRILAEMSKEGQT